MVGGRLVRLARGRWRRWLRLRDGLWSRREVTNAQGHVGSRLKDGNLLVVVVNAELAIQMLADLDLSAGPGAALGAGRDLEAVLIE